MSSAARNTPHRKAWLAVLLLLVLGAVCIAAGRWQLSRAHQREALLAAITVGRQAPARPLDRQHPNGPDWHPATATGHWLNAFTVLLDNRNLKGQPGLWVATPLALQDDPNTAVLVLRGWVSRPLPPQTLPDLSGAKGVAIVQGTILHRIPRLFDLGSLTGHPDDRLPDPFPAANGAPPRVQNLSLETFAKASGLRLLPVVLEQAPADDAGLTQEWPGPSLNADRNYNYAMQWFIFATIAWVAAAWISWRHLKTRQA